MTTIDKELIEQYWPLTKVEIGDRLKQIEGVERVVGTINSKEGKYTYKIADPWKTKESLATNLKMFGFLNSVHFKHITTLLKTKEGADFIEINGSYLYVLVFIEGSNPEESPENYKKLGEITAELHNIQDCPYETKFKANYIIEHNLHDNVEKLSLGTEYLDLVKQQPDYDQLPKTVIHTDIAPGNSIKKLDKEIILIDWDDAGVGTTILDIGHPLINQFITEDLEYKEANAKAFYDAYFSKRTTSQFEKDHIFDAAMFYALFYIEFGAGPEKRWRRIKWALENRKKLESLYL